MGANVQMGGRSHPYRKRVYYAGSETLKTGYPLCYDDFAAEPATGTYSGEMPGVQVNKPDASNVKMLAGIVDVSGNGMKGPGWVNVQPPVTGDTLEVYTNSDLSAGDVVKIAAGSWVLAAEGTPSADFDEVGVVVCAKDTSTTAGVTKVVVRSR